jgi:ABC-2 type transport system ATP-binding protein
MSQIVFEGLVKTFRIAERQAGMAGALRGIVHRRHRSLRALDGVSFTLEAGDLVGYIGPNGAGKSTTVKILAGILVPMGPAVRSSGACPGASASPTRARSALNRTGFIGGLFP